MNKAQARKEALKLTRALELEVARYGYRPEQDRLLEQVVRIREVLEEAQ